MNCPIACPFALAGLPPCVLDALGPCPCRCLFRNDRVVVVLVGLSSEARLSLPVATTMTVTYGQVEIADGPGRSLASTGMSRTLPRHASLQARQPADLMLVLEMRASVGETLRTGGLRGYP